MNRALRRWEWLTEWPLTISAVIFLVAYAAPIIDANLARPWVLACRIVAWITWTMFAVDYLARLILADNRRRYATRHLLDLEVRIMLVNRHRRPRSRCAGHSNRLERANGRGLAERPWTRPTLRSAFSAVRRLGLAATA